MCLGFGLIGGLVFLGGGTVLLLESKDDNVGTFDSTFV